MLSTTDTMSSLYDGQRCWLKILQLLMNMDEQLQPRLCHRFGEDICLHAQQQESSLMNRHCINGSTCVEMEKLTAAEFWELLRDQ